jgi:hypothetical protein
MGLHLFPVGRAAWDEPCASITWREYVSALAAASSDPAETASAILRVRPGGAATRRPPGEAPLARPGESEVAHLEIALRLVQRQARRTIGLAEILRLSCEAAKIRLLLVPLYMRLGQVDRAKSLAREIQTVL